MDIGEELDRLEVEEFLYREARLLDEHRYEEWEALWAEDGTYWIPANGEDADPDQKVSYVYDNKNRLRTRVRQLLTGDRYSQLPQSRTQHLISNLEVTELGTVEAAVRSGFLVVESRLGEMNLWPGKAIHRLRKTEGKLEIVMKKIVLVNNDQPITSMAFLL